MVAVVGAVIDDRHVAQLTGSVVDYGLEQGARCNHERSASLYLVKNIFTFFLAIFTLLAWPIFTVLTQACDRMRERWQIYTEVRQKHKKLKKEKAK